jgi:hypothetical protein
MSLFMAPRIEHTTVYRATGIRRIVGCEIDRLPDNFRPNKICPARRPANGPGVSTKTDFLGIAARSSFRAR